MIDVNNDKTIYVTELKDALKGWPPNWNVKLDSLFESLDVEGTGVIGSTNSAATVPPRYVSFILFVHFVCRQEGYFKPLTVDSFRLPCLLPPPTKKLALQGKGQRHSMSLTQTNRVS